MSIVWSLEDTRGKKVLFILPPASHPQQKQSPRGSAVGTPGLERAGREWRWKTWRRIDEPRMPSRLRAVFVELDAGCAALRGEENKDV